MNENKPTYKIGDRVRATFFLPWLNKYVTAIGTIVDVRGEGAIEKIDWDDDYLEDTSWRSSDNLSIAPDDPDPET